MVKIIFAKHLPTSKEADEIKHRYDLLGSDYPVTITTHIYADKLSTFSVGIHTYEKVGLCQDCSFRDLKPDPNPDADPDLDPYYSICFYCTEFEGFTTEPVENIEIPQWHYTASVGEAIEQTIAQQEKIDDDPAYYSKQPNKESLEALKPIDYELCAAKLEQWKQDIEEKITLIENSKGRFFFDKRGKLRDFEDEEDRAYLRKIQEQNRKVGKSKPRNRAAQFDKWKQEIREKIGKIEDPSKKEILKQFIEKKIKTLSKKESKGIKRIVK